nr:thiamine pyrophosphate-dependent enzyme [Halogeometricum sp. CBA1124]
MDLGFTIVVFNDDDYGLISEKQEAHTGEHFGTELTNPDFEAFAESFGVEAYRPETWDEVATALDDAVESGAMTLVEIPIPR